MTTEPLPTRNLDGKVDTGNYALTLTARPFPKARVKLADRYDERDNRTPQSDYLYEVMDSGKTPNPAVAVLLVLGRADYLAPYDTAGGQTFLGIVLGVYALLLLRVQRLSRFPAPARFLTAGAAARPGRAEAEMVYDPNREVVILFGGRTSGAGSVFYNDAWEWNGVSPPTGRRARPLAPATPRCLFWAPAWLSAPMFAIFSTTTSGSPWPA
mgnify:CR=1 FL=1